MSKKTQSSVVAAQTPAVVVDQAPVVSNVAAVIAKRGTEFKPTNKAGYLRALVTAIVADFNAGVDVSYVSQCDNYYDIASGKGLENRVGRQEGQPNSRRMLRALVSQELALLMQTTVADRLARSKAGTSASSKLAGLDQTKTIQIIQDGSTAWDAFVSKLMGLKDDPLHQFAVWFRDASASNWQSKIAPADLPSETPVSVAESAPEVVAETVAE